MNLPDFGLVVDFILLRQAMGVAEIPLLEPVKFTREVHEKRVVVEEDPADRKLLDDLKKGALAVPQSRVSVVDGLLTINGRKVAAYIRDQKQGIDWRSGSSSYKYHLTDCRTLQWMRQEGRERRYLVTKRSDGLFPVHDLGWHGRSGTVRLELCHNCRGQLRAMRKWFDPFNLVEYFRRYDTDVPRTIRREETVTTVQNYQPNHDDISREYRKAAGYRCQLCRVDCRERPDLLHLHHRDGDPSNNAHANLAVLCVKCHMNQPFHGHMASTGKFRQQEALIEALQRDQGLVLGALSSAAGP